MSKYASTLINQAKSWIGYKESDGSHKKIIDTYNKHTPRARGYKVKYTDAWCVTFVSACAIATGMEDLFPIECSCDYMINGFKDAGTWIENESITPEPGYIIFYDWEDNGKGDNKGSSDHVGIVEKVSNGKISVIEGNYGNAVKRRSLSLNGCYIRGYGAPKYDKEKATTTTTATKKESTQSTTSSSGGLNKTPKWVGKVTASALNVRTWGGKEYPNIKSYPIIKRDNLVDVCDSVKDKKGDKWYYIRIGGKTYGFVSAQYIAKA